MVSKWRLYVQTNRKAKSVFERMLMIYLPSTKYITIKLRQHCGIGRDIVYTSIQLNITRLLPLSHFLDIFAGIEILLVKLQSNQRSYVPLKPEEKKVAFLDSLVVILFTLGISIVYNMFCILVLLRENDAIIYETKEPQTIMQDCK